MLGSMKISLSELKRMTVFEILDLGRVQDWYVDQVNKQAPKVK